MKTVLRMVQMDEYNILCQYRPARPCVDTKHRVHALPVTLDRPDKPIISKAGSDGYRQPTPWRTSVWPLLTTSTREGSASVDLSVYEKKAMGTSMWQPQGLPSVSDVATRNRLDTLRIKLRNNVADEILDVSMVLAEMQSTVQTGASLLDRIGRSMLQFRKRNRKGFYYLLNGRLPNGRRPTDRFIRQTASEYLQWKYGIMPSVYDLEGVTAALDANAKGSLWDNPPLLVGRAIDTEKYRRTVRATTGWSSTEDFPVESTITLKGRVDYRVRSEGIRGLNRYGIGLTSLATVAWDKTPFTFVLDMAVPIASLIKSWGALSGVDVLSYCETYHVRHVCPGGRIFTDIERGDRKCINELEPASALDFRRVVFPTIPVPLPVVRNPIKTGNLATVLALFAQLRSS